MRGAAARLTRLTTICAPKPAPRAKAASSAAQMATSDGGCPTTLQLGEFTQRQLGPDVFDLGAGQPGPSSLPMDKIAAAAAHRFGSPGANPLVLQYGHEQGYASYREALAGFLTAGYSHPVSPDDLMVTAGVSHGIDLCCRQLASPGDVILVERPTYFLLQPIIDQNHLRTVDVPTDDQGIDVDALETLLQRGGVKPRLLYTVPVHSNPRGAVLPLARRKKLIALAHTYGFDIIADEVYQLLTFPESPPPPPPMRAAEAAMRAAGELPPTAATSPTDESTAGGDHPAAAAAVAAIAAATGQPPPAAGPAAAAATAGGEGSEAAGVSRVVSLGTYSKMLAPGLRLGWAEAAPAQLKRLRGCGVLISGGCIAPFSAAVAHSTIELGLLSDHLHNHVRPVLSERCAAMCEEIDARLAPLGCSYQRPQGGYFVWLTLPGQLDSRQLLEGPATRHKVRFAPGPACFGPPNALRLSFSFYTPAELREAVRRLEDALKEALAA